MLTWADYCMLLHVAEWRRKIHADVGQGNRIWNSWANAACINSKTTARFRTTARCGAAQPNLEFVGMLCARPPHLSGAHCWMSRPTGLLKSY